MVKRYDASVKHGLIAAPYDQSTGVQWYNGSSVFTGANGIAIGTGNENTNAIVSIQGVGNYAAKLCSDLDIGGYSDWYLPSKNELSKLFINRVAIGGFANSEYWSSSEYIGTNNWKAWSQSFSDGGQHDYSKDYVFNVRAVRAF